MRSLCPLDTWLDKKPPHVLTTHPHHERNNAAAARRLTAKQSCPEEEKKKIPFLFQRDSRALYRQSWHRAGFPELLWQKGVLGTQIQWFEISTVFFRSSRLGFDC